MTIPPVTGLRKRTLAQYLFSFDTATLNPGLSLQIGLLNPIATGQGFDALTFTIYVEGIATSETFSDLASAQAYLSDHILDFGSIGSLVYDGLLDVQLDLSLTASTIGDGFQVTVMLADSIQTIPEPSVGVLLGLAGFGFAFRRRRETVLDSRPAKFEF